MSALSRVVFAALLLAVSGCSSKLDSGVPEDTRIPLARISFLDGRYESTRQFLGQRTVLVFWAKWCSDSRPEMERLELLARANPDYRFIALSIDPLEEREQLERYIRKNSLQSIEHAFSGNAEEDEAAIAFRVERIPSIYLIDERGLVVQAVKDAEALKL